MKTQNIIPFEDGRMSNPDLFNYNLSLMIDDFNQLMLNGTNLENDIYRNVAIYDRDLIEQSRFAVSDLQGKIDLLKLLLSKEYTTGARVLSSKQSTLLSLREDPLNPGSYFTNICVDNNGAVELPKTATTSLSIKSITFTPAVNTSDSGTYSMLASSSSADGYDIIVSIEFDSIHSFNNLQFESLSDSSFDITQLNDEVLITKKNSYGKISLTFPTLTGSKLDVHIKLKDCRGTNVVDVSNLSNLFLNSIKNPAPGSFESYLYYFAISNITVSNQIFTADSIFVSEDIESIEPSKVLLDLDYTSENVNLEYYLHKKDYDVNGLIEGSEIVIPIEIEGSNTGNLLTPISDINILTHTAIFSYDHLNQILFDTVTIEEVIIGGENYLRFTLPYSPKTAAVTIVRKSKDGTTDNAAPIYVYSGIGQNVFVKGRFVYMAFPQVTYPKLYDCTYEISFELEVPAITEDIKYLKAQNNAIVINWEWFKNHYSTDYVKTIFNLVIIARDTSLIPASISLTNIRLFINTFNDLI